MDRHLRPASTALTNPRTWIRACVLAAAVAGTSLALGYNNMNAEDCPRQELRHFTSITSSFYRKLEAHYENVFEEWVKEQESKGPEGLRQETETNDTRQ